MTLVVPCFDEERRLDVAEFLRLAAPGTGYHLLFVDDGSRDGTARVLERLCEAARGRAALLRLERNSGKAEAVRRGLAAALAGGAEVVGYADADLATPVDELLRLAEHFRPLPIDVLLASRVRLLGTQIERRPLRHYLGRVLATLASLTLRLPVYDTQCGAKLLRHTPALEAALARPFHTRWVFDVELLQRLLLPPAGVPPIPAEAIHELPLRAWRDVHGSKLRLSAMIVAGLQLLGLFVRSFLPRPPAPAPAVPAVSAVGRDGHGEG